MRSSIVLLPFILLLTLHACDPSGQGAWVKIAGTTQGTTYSLTYLDHDTTDYHTVVDSLLHDFDLSFSTYIHESLISRINQGSGNIIPNQIFLSCFNASRRVHKESNGAFDITVAPVVNAWGFGFTERARIDSSLIDSLMQYVGMNKVAYRQGVIWKENPAVMIDMNAIAQGLAVDVLAEFLESKRIMNYLVEIGGEIKTLGTSPQGTTWRVGIDKPIEGLQVPGVELEAVVSLSGKSLATSGNYRRFYEENGIKYSHTIDPSTGYPVHHSLLSATVLCEECMYADAYATAFMVMGFERSRDFLTERPDLDVFLIYNDHQGEYKTWYTEGMEKALVKRGY